MGWGLKRNATGGIERSSIDGHLCICPVISDYTVVFPNTDSNTYERTYPLTESGGVWVASGSFSLFIFLNVILDLCVLSETTGGTMYNFDFTIEMSIDGGTGERSVRTIINVTANIMGNDWAGTADDTEVFASGSTFNMSAGTNRYVLMAQV